MYVYCQNILSHILFRFKRKIWNREFSFKALSVFRVAIFSKESKDNQLSNQELQYFQKPLTIVKRQPTLQSKLNSPLFCNSEDSFMVY